MGANPKRIPLPRMAGGQDLDAMLKNIQEELQTLNARKANGEDVSKEVESLTQQKAAVEAEKKSAEETGQGQSINNPQPQTTSELELLREFRRKKEIEEIASKAAEVAEHAYRQQQASQQHEIQQAIEKAVRDRLGIDAGGVAPLIRQELENVRVPERFVGEGASEETAKHIAGGGGLEIQDPRSMKAGAERDVKAFYESKSLVRFMSAIHRLHKGVASDTEKKALAESTASAGGYLVPQEWMPDILGLIRAQAIVRQAGPRIIPFSKAMNQTSISLPAQASYIAENAAIVPSEQTFDEAPLLTPKNLTALVPVSNYLLEDAAEAEEIVRADLAEVLALKEDISFLQGDGSGGSPVGFKNMSSITNMTGAGFLNLPATGVAFNDEHARRMIAEFRRLNVRTPRLAFFFNPAVLTQLELIKDNEGRYLLDSGALKIDANQAGGTLWGVPFFTSTQIPTNLGANSNLTYILLVNMAETIVGINKELTIDASSEAAYVVSGTWYSAFQNNQTLFRSVMRHDINHRRKSQVILLENIRV